MLEHADLLSALLTRVRLDAQFLCDTASPRHWQPPHAAGINAVFVYAARGQVELGDGDGAWVLREGALALFPHSVAERWARPDAPTSLPGALLRAPPAASAGDRAPAPRALCAGLHYDATSAMPLCRLFPPAMIVDAAAVAAAPMLSHALRGLGQELERAAALRSTVLPRALELIYSLGLELAVAVGDGERDGGAGVLRDPRIARCLYYMYTHFGEKCSLQELAAHAGMSKSALSARFNALVGEPPARHLARIRVAEARRLLRETELSQDAVAQQVGYASVVGMHLAFRAIAGEPPGASRRRAQPGEAG